MLKRAFSATVCLVRRKAPAISLYDIETNGEAALLDRCRQLDIQTVFDVGANVGGWSLRARKALPEAKIYSFELSKDTFQNLLLRTSNAAVCSFNLGLSDSNGSIRFKDYGQDAGGNTTITRASFHDRKTDFSFQNAEVMTGDTFCAAKGITEIDFLKIDVEGAEQRVLHGFAGMLAGRAIRILQFEYGYANGDDHFLMRNFYDLFEGYGYCVARLGREGRLAFRPWEYRDNDFTSGPNYVAVQMDDLEARSVLESE